MHTYNPEDIKKITKLGYKQKVKIETAIKETLQEIKLI
jgi:hypothetical protein